MIGLGQLKKPRISIVERTEGNNPSEWIRDQLVYAAAGIDIHDITQPEITSLDIYND